MKYMFFKVTVLCVSVLFNINSIMAQEVNDSIEGFQFDTIATVPNSTVKSQDNSGTCWSYAATSFVETEIMRIDGRELDLSEMYFVYYAYQAKAENYVRMHGSSNFGPGGQAHDVTKVIAEHGIVLDADYPGFIGGFDKHVHGELDNVLRGFVKSVIKNPSRKLSTAWQGAFTSILNSYLGDPEPLEEKAKQLVVETKFNADDYVEITSYKYLPYYKNVHLQLPDNWSYNDYYNIPLDEMMNLIQSALKQGYSVCWDGDVSNKGFSHAKALAILPETEVENLEGSEQSKWEEMSPTELYKNMYSFKSPVPEKQVTEDMRQAAFDNYQVTDDHLMHLTALLKDQNGTAYYVTKNSWKATSNDNGGYLNMSDAYLRMNTVAIMLHKDALPKELKKKLEIK